MSRRKKALLDKVTESVNTMELLNKKTDDSSYINPAL